jgi:hypothetical protein
MAQVQGYVAMSGKRRCCYGCGGSMEFLVLAFLGILFVASWFQTI